MSDTDSVVRIVSNGTPTGTSVYIDGKPVHGWVTELAWHCEVDHLATATITFEHVEVDVVGVLANAPDVEESSSPSHSVDSPFGI